jgi:uncharacterized protein
VIKKLLLIVLISYVGLASIASAQNIPERPVPPRLVNDLAGTLTPHEAQQLENTLVDFNNRTSNQIAVVIVPELYGFDKSDLATRIGHAWGVGQSEFDNGVVVLVKPRSGNQRGEAFIAVGYGLEPVITDAASRRIIENEMIPHFTEGNYYHGILAGAGVLMQLAEGEISSDQYAPQISPFVGLFPVIIILLVFFLITRSGSRQKSFGKNIPFWTMLFLMSNMSGGKGSFGNFSSGKGSFGSRGGFGGGGSFGGFGGGRFGGGGAGGSW